VFDVIGAAGCGKIRFSRAAIMRWLDPWSSQGAKEGQ
jgi:hypothetical protein